MSDGGANRPRRAFDPAEDASDDTPTVASSGPRRGQIWHPTSEAAPADPADEMTLVPPPSATGKRFSAAALPDGPQATARRSATSALSPLEPEPVSPASAALNHAFTEGGKRRPLSRISGSVGAATHQVTKVVDERFNGNRFNVAFVAVAAFAALTLIIGMTISAFNPTHPSAQPSVKPSVAPAVTAADLWTPDDLPTAVPDTTWHTSQTLTTLTATSPQVACLSALVGKVKPEASAQRTLTAAGNTGLAALHQVDVYASAADAQAIFSERQAKLALCDDSAAYLVSAANISNIGDEASQMTVAYQAEKTEYHTVLMVRTGTLVSLFDVARPETAAPTASTARAAAAALGRSCARFGTCPAEVKASETILPKAAPAGWLIESDWPRVTPGTGRWTATEPVALKTIGSACENLTLETVTGPTSRQQRTFLLTQDAKAPQSFGADEMLLSFADATASADFAKQLGDNVASCAQRLQTATVSEAGAVQGKAGDAAIVGRTFTVTQATGQDKKVVFQVAVLNVKEHVVYILVNTTEAFKLTPEQLAAVAVRAGQRSTQLS